MKTNFILPSTPMCQVVFTREGDASQVKYGQNIPTPKSNSDLEIAMLRHQVSARHIVEVRPIEPLKPLRRPHPAFSRINRLANTLD